MPSEVVREALFSTTKDVRVQGLGSALTLAFKIDFESSLTLTMFEGCQLKEGLSIFTFGWSSKTFLESVSRINLMNAKGSHHLQRRTGSPSLEDVGPESALCHTAKTQPTRRTSASNLVQE